MSTKSINTLTRETYLKEAEENLLRMSDAYFYKNKFLMGEGVDEDKQDFYMQSHRYLCTDSCTMTQFIQDKIEGKLEECGKKPKDKQTIHDILRFVSSESSKSKPKNVGTKVKDTESGIIHNSMSEAARELNINLCNLRYWLKEDIK